MNLSKDVKEHIINIIQTKLSHFSEINKIILFGSFQKSQNPNDIDIAVIQNSKENYLTLSLKYRKALRELSKKFPLDIVPIKNNSHSSFLDEINQGYTIYER
ncbi:nucleotidyltransferase domain-containing protein [bacterium]|nr:nucleotidyltransferase domain-containing protein [bacterium]MBU1958580.1 nucleotidyltransferase domain-containing protein [bacterium]